MNAASEVSASTAQLTAKSFGQRHFGACEFGDARLTKRAVKTAELMMRHPGGTLPQKLNAEADLDDLDGFYNFANNPKVNHDTVLGGHVEQTRERLVLWRGWTKLQLLVDGAAGRSARCAET